MKLSIVDLSPVPANGDRHQAILNTIEVAQQAEKYGFTRIWLAEHHAAGGMAGRAPEVLIPLITASTKTIRVGSGSVLLNHYSPFKVAETFCTLEDMFPGRIDMGIGRATTGPISDIALQRNRSYRQTTDDSAEQLVELTSWLNDDFDIKHPFGQVTVYKNGTIPPLWLLGSSRWSATIAAQLGLRYAFAGFINPGLSFEITQAYKDNFLPSSKQTGIDQPELLLSLSVYCAPTDEEAARLTAPVRVMMQRLAQGDISGLLPGEEEAVEILGGLPATDVLVDPRMPPRILAGTPGKLHQWLNQIAAIYGTDEIILQCITPNHQARLLSHQLLAKEFGLY